MRRRAGDGLAEFQFGRSQRDPMANRRRRKLPSAIWHFSMARTGRVGEEADRPTGIQHAVAVRCILTDFQILDERSAGFFSAKLRTIRGMVARSIVDHDYFRRRSHAELCNSARFSGLRPDGALVIAGITML